MIENNVRCYAWHHTIFQHIGSCQENNDQIRWTRRATIEFEGEKNIAILLDIQFSPRKTSTDDYFPGDH